MANKFPRSKKAQTERMGEILSVMEKEYPGVTISLNYDTPHQLMVATILSAQCTDERVNIVTESLFKKYRYPADYLEVPQEELEQDIYSTGFYKAKAKNIRAATRMILEDYDGDVPGNMEDLLKLPGVGRKTANVILGHAFGVPGIVVDTHVIRISNRLGFVSTKDPVKIEKKLDSLVPEEKWVIFTHYFISHGRKVCKARKPDCEACKISHLCPSAFSFG